jgi:type I restriction enzyme M protein
VVHAEVKHDAPLDIIKELRALEKEIAEGLTKLEEMLA